MCEKCVAALNAAMEGHAVTMEHLEHADVIKHHDDSDIKLFERILEFSGLELLIGHARYSVIVLPTLGLESLLVEAKDEVGHMVLASGCGLPRGGGFMVAEYRTQAKMVGLLDD
jgi:hypothetical protein